MEKSTAAKRLLALICLSAALCVFSFGACAETIDSGYCGSDGGIDLRWTLDKTGTLTVRGTGEMKDFRRDDGNDSVAPWCRTASNRNRIKEVVIEDGVTKIGNQAFAGCSNLAKVTVPDSLTRVGYYAFSSTRWYDYQPDGLIYLGKVAYQIKGNGPKTIVIQEGTKGIAGYAFSGRFVNVVVPDSVTDIGPYAFLNVHRIFYLGTEEQWKRINNQSGHTPSFYDCLLEDCFVYNKAKTTLQAVSDKELTEAVIPDGVTSIGRSVFSGCARLTGVTIPDSVTTIGASAFSGCARLTSVTIPDGVTSIGASAFSDCAGLTAVTIPEHVTKLENSVFQKCTGLASVSIGESVTSIGNSAFNNCVSLAGVIIPDSVKSIGADAFKGCAGLAVATIGNRVTSIGDGAFSGCASLAGVTIPDGVTRIGKDAFHGCERLTTVTIPDSVKSIGEHAFGGCTGLACLTIGKPIENYTLSDLSIPDDSLTTVILTDGATGIRSGAFSDYTGISAFISAENNPAFSSEDGILFNRDKTELIRYPAAKEGNAFPFPETVTSLTDGAFSDNRYLTDVRIPSRIKSLGAGCFARCRRLQTAICGNGAAALPAMMFKDCPALKAVSIPYGVSRIGAQAFSGCRALTTVTLSNDMEMIGERAFYGCRGIDDIFFNGTADEWMAIGVKEGNSALSGGRKHFGAMLTPQAVSGVEVVKKGDRSVTLQWQPVKGATEYRVYGRQTATQTDSLLATVTEIPCEIGGLTPGTGYTIAVEAAAVTAEQTLTAEKSDPVIVTTLEPTQTPGDVDGDSAITSADARLALRTSVGLEKDITKGKAAYLAADADSDGEVTSGDARLILRASVGLEDAGKFGKKA